MYCLYLIFVLVLIPNVDSALCCYIFVCCQLRNQETSFKRMLNMHFRAFFVADLFLSSRCQTIHHYLSKRRCLSENIINAVILNYNVYKVLKTSIFRFFIWINFFTKFYRNVSTAFIWGYIIVWHHKQKCMLKFININYFKTFP